MTFNLWSIGHTDTSMWSVTVLSILNTHTHTHISFPKMFCIKKRNACHNKTMYVEHNIEAHSCINCCSEKSISSTYSEHEFVDLGIQHATPCTVLSPEAYLALQNFSTLSHKHYLKNTIEHKARVLIFSTTFVRNISHSKKNWARYDKKRLVVFTCPLLLSDFN